MYLVLGCGGTDANLDVFIDDATTAQPEGKVITEANRPVPTSTPSVRTRPGAGGDHRDPLRTQLLLPLLPAGAAEIAPGVGLVTGDDGGGLVSVHGLAT